MEITFKGSEPTLPASDGGSGMAYHAGQTRQEFVNICSVLVPNGNALCS